MPEISLRAYTAKLEDLLRINATDEVIHHCRHILQHFPKNVDIYRLLGQALLVKTRYDEAAAAFRRVLSVYPDDATAHAGLSEAYEQRGRPNDAIWHMERAFEQDPNNKEIIDGLRDLFKRHQNTEHTRIQLTTAAVARQYVRNGMYDEALHLLRETLERSPDRVDLRLLLAETIWKLGDSVGGAEVALEVLQSLPDCLPANRIMTELWLGAERPSDAQRFLNRLEDVDPYLALELAQGAEADENAFTLEELDYRRYAQRELATNRPDWLQEIGDSSNVFSSLFGDMETSTEQSDDDEWPAWATMNSAPPPANEHTTVESLFGDVNANDWLNEQNALREKTGTGPLTDDHKRFDDRLDDVEPPESIVDIHARELKRETASTANIFKKTSTDETEIPDWLKNVEVEDDFAPAPVADDEDPLAWMRDAGVELDDEAMQADVFGAPVSEVTSENLPDWLANAEIPGDGPTFNFDTGEFTDAAREAAPPAATSAEDDANPFAWMQESGVEFEEDVDPTTIPSSAASDEDDDQPALGDLVTSTPATHQPTDDEEPSLEDFVPTPESAAEADAWAFEDLVAASSLDTFEENATTGFAVGGAAVSTEQDETDDEWQMFGDEDEGETDFDDRLRSATSEPKRPDAPPADENEDLVAWVRSTSEMDALDEEDEAVVTDSSAAFEDEEDDEDPLAWMRDAGFEVDDAPAAEVEASARDDDDPFAWMQSAGVELDDNPPAPVVSSEPATFEHEADDPLAWMREAGIEVDESAEAAVNYDPYETEDHDMEIHDPAADPLTWMQGYRDLLVENDEQEAAEPPLAAPGPREQVLLTGERPVDDGDTLDWLQDETLLEDVSETAREAPASRSEPLPQVEDPSPTEPVRKPTGRTGLLSWTTRLENSADAHAGATDEGTTPDEPTVPAEEAPHMVATTEVPRVTFEPETHQPPADADKPETLPTDDTAPKRRPGELTGLLSWTRRLEGGEVGNDDPSSKKKDRTE